MRISDLIDTPPRSAATNAQDESRPGVNWILQGAFVATACVFAVVFSTTFASLAHTWAHSGTYEYGFLIGPVCLALVWMRRGRLAQVAARPKMVGLVGVCFFCLTWLAGAFAHINLAQHVSVIALVAVLVYTFYGPAVTRVLIFPLAYMLFAIPFGNFMVGPLQDVTAHLSVFVLQLTSVPVYMAERTILTPAGTWHVAEACSGVKFFFATTAFGVLYANLFFQSWKRRIIFVICAMIVPVLANGLRVFFTILIGEYFGIQYATGTDHMIFGWQFFGLVMLLLFLAGWPWHELSVAPGSASSPSAEPARRVVLGITTVCIGLFVLTPAWHGYAQARLASAPAVTEWGGPPDRLGRLTRVRSPQTHIDTGLKFANATVRDTFYYAASDELLRIDYARYAGADDKDGEMLTFGNRIYSPASWRVVTRQAAALGEESLGFEQLTLEQRSAGGKALVWYVYRVNGHRTTSPFAVKVWKAWYAARGIAAATEVLAITAVGTVPPAVATEVATALSPLLDAVRTARGDDA